MTVSRSAVLAVALGVLAAVLSGLAVHLWTVVVADAWGRVPPPLDRVSAAIEELREDGVHVAPDARDQLSEAEEAAVEGLVAEGEVPVRVIVWTPSREGGADAVTAWDQIEAAFADERSVVVVWERPRSTGRVLSTGGYARVDHPELLGRAADTLPEVVRAAQAAEWFEATGEDYWGGRDGGLLAGALFAVGAIPAALLLLGLGRLLLGLPFRLPGSWFGTADPEPRRRGRR